jgi:hypothetical protein
MGVGPAFTRAWRCSTRRSAQDVFALGPEILFRSQPHGSYKLFFNALLLSAAK